MTSKIVRGALLPAALIVSACAGGGGGGGGGGSGVGAISIEGGNIPIIIENPGAP